MAELNPIFRYPLDLTGKSPNNLVSKELHTPIRLDGANELLVIPTYGGFYSESVSLRDANYDLLSEGSDYVCTYVYEDASLRTGRSVMGAILILRELEGDVYFGAQMVGYDYAYSTTVKKDIETWYANHPNTRPTNGGIVGKAQVFTDGEFRKTLWTFDGYEPTAAEMERIARELLLGDLEGLQALHGELDAENVTAGDGTTSQEKKLNNHINDRSNPHHDTVPLDTRLQNWAESTSDVSADNDDSIALPETLVSVINQVFGSQIEDHANNHGNPHHDHISQLGGLDKATIDARFATRLPRGNTADSTGNVEGRSETTLSSEVNTFYDASNFNTGRLPLETLGLGTRDASTVLTGDGNFRSITSIFSEYDKPAVHCYFEGTLGPDNEAIAFVRTKYQDINQYPDGSIVLWNTAREIVIWNGNDATQQSVQNLTRCARRNGWTWDFDYNWSSSYYSTTNYRYENTGDWTVYPAPGTYSIFAVGGGGGGNGQWNRGCGGGGSGYAGKVRVTIKAGDYLRVKVGGGGNFQEWIGDNGQETIVDKNGSRLLTAGGGQGAIRWGNDWWYAQGGYGGSGGGASSGRWEHGRHDFHPSVSGSGGTNGTSGGWSYDQPADSWRIPPGSGAGTNYYTNVMKSVDSTINHGFGSMGNGGSAYQKGEGQRNGTLVTTRAGGGGGVGTQQFGSSFYWKGDWANCTGYGFGAGGGGMQPGIRGMVSILRIRHF